MRCSQGRAMETVREGLGAGDGDGDGRQMRAPDGAKRARGFARATRRVSSPRSSRAPTTLAFVCVLFALTAVTRGESPYDSRFVSGNTFREGTVVVRHLTPGKGFVSGGELVEVRGSGFTSALACQFGASVVSPLSVADDGTTMTCLTPAMTGHHRNGGFAAVGVTVGAGGGSGAGAASPTKGALTFQFVAVPLLKQIQPISFDADGGSILAIQGAHLHNCGACVWTHAAVSERVAFSEIEIVSSALVLCAAPAALPGRVVVSLAANSLDDLRKKSGHAQHVINDGNVPGLAVTAYHRVAGEHGTISSANGEEIFLWRRERNTSTATSKNSSFLAAAASAIDEMGSASQPFPVPRTILPNRGPGEGNAPIWISGFDFVSPKTSPGPGSVVFCLFRFGGFGGLQKDGADKSRQNRNHRALAVAGVSVSSALVACERPVVPTGRPRGVTTVEVGVPSADGWHGMERPSKNSNEIKWSSAGDVSFAPWGNTGKVTRVSPNVLISEGGVETALFGTEFPVSSLAATCRFGTIGPVAGRTRTSDALICVSPAMAPSPRFVNSPRGVAMYGPDPDANAGFFAAGAGAGWDSLMVTVTETDPARYARAPDAARAYDAQAAAESETGFGFSLGLRVSDTIESEPPSTEKVYRTGSGAVVVSGFPKSVPSEFGGLLTLTGSFGALPTTQPVCRFGQIAVKGRVTSESAAGVECFAPSLAPATVRVAVDGTEGFVELTVSPASFDVATRNEDNGKQTEYPNVVAPQLDHPACQYATPDLVDNSGGGLVWVVGKHFGGPNNLQCLWRDEASGSTVTAARVISASLVACETFGVPGKPGDSHGTLSVVVEGSLEGTGTGGTGSTVRTVSTGTSTGTGTDIGTEHVPSHVPSGISFAMVNSVRITSVTPTSADWLQSPVVTLELSRNNFGSESLSLVAGSKIWIGTVGPLTPRRVSPTSVSCVAPAFAGTYFPITTFRLCDCPYETDTFLLQSGTRNAPVRFLTDISQPGNALLSPVIQFSVNAAKVSANGRPGGLWAGGIDSVDSKHDSKDDSKDSSKAGKYSGTVKRALAKVVSGGVPFVLVGARFGDVEGWCLFQDDSKRAWASAAVHISQALLRCDDSPPVTKGGGDVDIRLTNANGFARVHVRPRPVVQSALPSSISAAGGNEVTVFGSSFLDAIGNDDDAQRSDNEPNTLRIACRFGPIGPVTARAVSRSAVACVSPALTASAAVSRSAVSRSAVSRSAVSSSAATGLATGLAIGLALDTSLFLADTGWHDGARVLVDGGLVHDCAMSSFLLTAAGSVAGGASFDVTNVAGGSLQNAGPTTPPTCVFGGDDSVSVAGTWSRPSSRPSTVSCVSPPRLAQRGLGFVTVRVFLEPQTRFVTSANFEVAQFEFKPKPSVASVFPLRAWGPETVSVFGVHLRLGGDVAAGTAGGTYCAFPNSRHTVLSLSW